MKKAKSKVRIAFKNIQNVKKVLPPPPPPKRLPPPPPPRKVTPAPVEFQLPLPMQPARATHIRWASEDGKSTIEVPVGNFGDFSSFKSGKVTWGRIHEPRGEWEEITEGEGRQAEANVRQGIATPPRRMPPPPPPGSKAAATYVPPPPPRKATPRAPGAGKKEGVCAFIDARIMEGGRTAEQVLALVMAQFPGRDPKATLSTVKTRPSHIKAKGEVPPPFKK